MALLQRRSLSVALNFIRPRWDRPSSHVNRMDLRETKPIRDLAIIFAVEDRKVSKLSLFERTNLVATIEAVGWVDCRCRDRFRRRHFHLRTSEREHHRH